MELTHRWVVFLALSTCERSQKREFGSLNTLEMAKIMKKNRAMPWWEWLD